MPLRAAAVLFASALASGRAPAHAQVSAQTDSAALAAAAGVVSAPAASAEPWFRGGTWMLGLQVGGAAFTDFQRGMARSESSGPPGERYRRRVSAGTTGSIGVSAAYWLTGTIGVRTAIAYAPSTFSVWMEREAGLGGPAGEADATYPRLDVLLGDVSAVFRFPRVFGRVVPYGVTGVGVVRYTAGAGELPPEARDRFAGGARLTPAAVVGLGAVIPLQRRSLLLSFELTGHIAPTPLDDDGAGSRFELGGVPLRLEAHADQGGTDGVGLTNTVRLLVGITLPVR